MCLSACLSVYVSACVRARMRARARVCVCVCVCVCVEKSRGRDREEVGGGRGGEVICTFARSRIGNARSSHGQGQAYADGLQTAITPSSVPLSLYGEHGMSKNPHEAHEGLVLCMLYAVLFR